MTESSGALLPASSAPPPAAPPPPWYRRFAGGVRAYFVLEYPDAVAALTPLAFLAMALFTRHPGKTNFIFDEQEALLANPYVRSVANAASNLTWLDALRRDFWGLAPEGTIGSYRPLPNLVWRLLWWLGARESPFFHHGVNVLLHAFNGALLTSLVMRILGDRLVAWLAGALFVASAVLTEAVSGVVGLADVLGGMGALLTLHALRAPLWALGPAVFGATLFGLYAKESALAIVVLAPIAALALSGALASGPPRRLARTLVAGASAALAFVLYVELRRRLFPARLSPEIAEAAVRGKGALAEGYAGLLRWYAQPILPHDPLNNPLVRASFPFRVAGALRVYFRGALQILFPHPLAGDYSAPQEPIPESLFGVETVLGGLLLVGPALAGAALLVKSVRDQARHRAPMDGSSLAITEPRSAGQGGHPYATGLVAVCLLWIVISYLPVSNIPVVLPTVRAERFWYFPALGTSVLLALGTARILRAAEARGRLTAALVAVGVFFGFQCVAARGHANDYADDLTFWDAARHAVPRSAKAHLNYSVMLGARGDLQGRLAANARALELAPDWPMANVYYGDTLCRMNRVDEAWPHYLRGFPLAAQEINLLALGLQCLWDHKALEPGSPRRDELDERSRAYPGSWYEFLVRDVLEHGEEHHGVDPKHRPRGYNEGPKKE